MSIKFFGLIFSSDGIYLDLEKVTSLEEADVPKNKDELRSLTNFSSVFIENYSSIIAELRKLLHKHSKWEWNDKHQKSFEVLKKQFKGPLYLELFWSEVEYWGYLWSFSIWFIYYSYSILRGRK